MDNLFKNQGLGVTVRGLSKRYTMAAGEVHALRESSWDVAKGSAVAIMGPSGCGKTTLLNLLGGVDRPSSGTILIDGQDLTGMNERALETHRLRRVGFVFQFFNLIPEHHRVREHRAADGDGGNAGRGLPPALAGAARAGRARSQGGEASGGTERRRAAARRRGAGARERSRADPGRRTDRQPGLDQRRRRSRTCSSRSRPSTGRR